MSTFWAMSIAHSFMSILIHRAGFMSIARYEFYDNIGSMYELCSYYDSGFIINELSSYISCMTFIMIPTRSSPIFTSTSNPTSRRLTQAEKVKLNCDLEQDPTQLQTFTNHQIPTARRKEKGLDI